jgi:hypothetical protein
MLTRETPLRGHELFQTVSAKDLCREIQQRVGARCSFPAAVANLRANVSQYHLPSTELWYGDTAMPLRIEFDAGPFTRMRIRRAGSGITHIGGEPVRVDASQSCISPNGAVLEYPVASQQLIWRMGDEA